MNVNKIKTAVSYVHFWEARERGAERMTRATAAKHAIQIGGLSEEERAVLLNAIHVDPKELA